MTARPFSIEHVHIVTGDADGTLLRDQSIVVDGDGRIESVRPAAEVAEPPGRRIDGAGAFALPGLINAHAHLFADGTPLPPILTSERAEKLVSVFMKSPFGKRMLKRRTEQNLTTQLRSGVTTVRSVGDVGYEVVNARAAIERGELVGPRVMASGPLLAISGGHGAPGIALIADNPQEARAQALTLLDHGVTAMKISATGGVTDAREIGQAGAPEMPEASMRAICEVAHAAGVLVAAHAQSAAGILAALRAGVDTIEHGAIMTPEVIELFKENPASLRGWSALIPTLQACLPLVKLDQSITGADDVVRANAELIMEQMLGGIRDALEHDIPIGLGTDSALTYVTHDNTWRELDLLVRYGGLSTVQALHAATGGNAKILGIEDQTGAIAPGLAADIMLVQDNPLDSMRALAAPTLVSARGRILANLAVPRFPDIDAHLDTI